MNILRLQFLPAKSILAGYYICTESIEDSPTVSGEVEEVSLAEPDKVTIRLKGQEFSLDPNFAVALVRPLEIHADTNNPNKSPLALTALATLNDINTVGGIYTDGGGHFDFAEDVDDDFSWPALASTAETMYSALLKANNPYACLIINRIEQ